MTLSRTDALAIADRYATAMFDLSEDAGASDALAEEFAALGEAVKSNESLDAFLKNPLIARETKEAALLEIAKKSNALTKQSLSTIAEQGRAELIPVIAETFAKRVAESKGEVTAEITSARPLSPAMEKQIGEALKKATGKPVTMKLLEDASVLGGVKIRVGSLQLDATLAGALESMRARLLTHTN